MRMAKKNYIEKKCLRLISVSFNAFNFNVKYNFDITSNIDQKIKM